MNESSANPAQPPMVLMATRFQRGASRGQSQPSQRAYIDLSHWPQIGGQELLGLMDMLVADQLFQRTWPNYRLTLQQQWQDLPAVDPSGVAQLALWLWVKLLHDHMKRDISGTHRRISSSRFELTVPKTDNPAESIALLGLVIKTFNRVAALSHTSDAQDAQSALGGYLSKERAGLPLGKLSWNTVYLRQAAEKQGIPWFNLKSGADQFGWGRRARRLLSTHTDRTSLLAQQIVKNKATTNVLLSEAGLPVPRQGVAKTEAACVELAQRIGYPVVVKPAAQDFGRGVHAGLMSGDEVKRAYAQASAYGLTLVESHVEGREYRLTVVGNRVLAAYERISPTLSGDGVRTVGQLLDELNADPRRGRYPDGLVRIERDEEMVEMFRRQNLSAESIPAAGSVVQLLRNPMIARGGTPVACLDQLHPDNRRMIERAVRLVGLDVAGVDFITPDISRSWRELGGAILEINSQPLLVSERIADPAHSIYDKILNSLFAGGNGRIPVVAVGCSAQQSGHLATLHQLLRQATPGILGTATCAGLWIGNDLETDQDVSGAAARDVLLIDSAVELALIQLTPQGLLQEGHPCDCYAVAALLSVPERTDGQLTREQMAQVMAEALERATQAVIVNAGEPLCVAMLQYATPKRQIMIGTSEQSEVLQLHLEQGGEVVVLTDSGVEVMVGKQRTLVISRDEWSSLAKLQGCDDPIVIVCAIALGHVLGMEIQDLRQGVVTLSSMVRGVD